MKTKKTLFTIINCIFLVFFGYVLFLLIFMDQGTKAEYYFRPTVPNIALAVVVTAVALFWHFLRRYLAKGDTVTIDSLAVKLNRKRLLRTLYISSAVLFVIQLVIAYSIYFKIGWDIALLRYAADHFVNGGYDQYSIDYMQTNPNNTWMLAINIFFAWLGKIFGFAADKAMIFVGIILLNLSVLFTALSIMELTNSNIATITSYIVSLLFFGLSPWMIVPYTDIYTIFLPILTFYLFIKLRLKEGMHPLLKGVVIILPAALGYHLKPTSIFVLIAIFMVELVNFIGEPKKFFKGSSSKKIFWQIISMALVLFSIFILDFGIKKAVDFTPNKAIEKPMEHYAFMGVNEKYYGQYNLADDNIISDIKGIDEKKTAAREMIGERLSDMGPIGYIQHLSRKTLLNFNNGIMGWGKEINFKADDEETVWHYRGFISEVIKNFYYVRADWYTEHTFGAGGQFFWVFANFDQFVWLGILMFSFVWVVKMLIGRNSRKGVIPEEEFVWAAREIIPIVMIGIFLFVSIFECNARYLFSYLPFFVMAGILGVKEK